MAGAVVSQRSVSSRTRRSALLLCWVAAASCLPLLPAFFVNMTSIFLALFLASIGPWAAIAGLVVSIVGRMWGSWLSALATLGLVIPAFLMPAITMLAFSQPYDPAGPCAGDGPATAAICPDGPTLDPSLARLVLIAAVVMMVLASRWWLRRITSVGVAPATPPTVNA